MIVICNTALLFVVFNFNCGLTYLDVPMPFGPAFLFRESDGTMKALLSLTGVMVLRILGRYVPMA